MGGANNHCANKDAIHTRINVRLIVRIMAGLTFFPLSLSISALLLALQLTTVQFSVGDGQQGMAAAMTRTLLWYGIRRGRGGLTQRACIILL